MIRFLLAAMALIAMALADMAPQNSSLSLVSMAWADDDDDDDDDRRRPHHRPPPPPPPHWG